MTHPRNHKDTELVAQLLQESGYSRTGPLAEALLELRAMGTAALPEPSGRLATLMEARAAVLRRRTRRRTALIGGAIAISMGAGVTGVAAVNQEFGAAAGRTWGTVVQKLAPHGPGGTQSLTVQEPEAASGALLPAQTTAAAAMPETGFSRESGAQPAGESFSAQRPPGVRGRPVHAGPAPRTALPVPAGMRSAAASVISQQSAHIERIPQVGRGVWAGVAVTEPAPGAQPLPPAGDRAGKATGEATSTAANGAAGREHIQRPAGAGVGIIQVRPGADASKK